LPIGFAGLFLAYAFIPLETQPIHSLHNLVFILSLGALFVRVLAAQDKNTVMFAGEQPIEKGCSDSADMQRAGGTGSETHPDLITMCLIRGHALLFYHRRNAWKIRLAAH